MFLTLIKKISFLLLVLININIFSQNENKLVINQKDSTVSAKDNIAYYIDHSRKLPFKDVKDKIFIKDTITLIDLQAITWYKISIKPTVNSEFFIFSPSFTPKSEVYIPLINGGYKTYKIGFLNNHKPIKNVLLETVLLTLRTDSINFSKPIYYTKYPIFKFGKNSIKEPAFVNFTNDKSKWLNELILKYSDLTIYQIIIAVIFLSSLMFLLNFIILKDNNFLNYSLYLFFTSLIFAPNFPVFFNILNSIHLGLFEYLGTFAIPMTATVYYYFVTQFVDVKNDYPKLKTLVNTTITISFIFSFYIVLQHVYFKYLPFRFKIENIYNLFFLTSAIVVFIYLIYQKISVLKRIVVFGSLFLIIGQILSLILDKPLFFLFGVLIEIIVFSIVVTLQHKATVLNKTNNLIALNNETEKHKNLVYLNKLKTRFITNLSHEFRTPLTLISAPLDQITNQHNLPDLVTNNLTIIKRNTNRLIELSNQLLDVSKLDEGNLQLNIFQQPINKLINNLINDFSYLAKQKNITFKINNKLNDNLLWFDIDVLKKILNNLLSNAIKYTLDKGTINIEISIIENSFIFKIKNTGDGLSIENQKKIFERFHQIDVNKQGAGIGLSLVKELVKLHKGKITVNSKLNHWSCFRIIIPIDKDSYNLQNAHKKKVTYLYDSFNLETKSNASLDKPLLLIVEDNKELCDFMEQLLNKDYKIIKAINGQEGLEKALKYIPNIIISDIMMPIMDGITLSYELNNNLLTSHIPILLLTAKSGLNNELKGVKSGAIDYITKPFSIEILQNKINNILTNQKAFHLKFSKELFKTKNIPYSNLDKEFIVNVKEILDDKLIESSFNIKEFSSSLGMSRMQLHRKLKALTGYSASEFIRTQRLKLAAELLKKSDVNIAEIAYGVGFNDTAYFSKCFKKHFGYTPSEFIKDSK